VILFGKQIIAAFDKAENRQFHGNVHSFQKGLDVIADKSGELGHHIRRNTADLSACPAACGRSGNAKSSGDLTVIESGFVFVITDNIFEFHIQHLTRISYIKRNHLTSKIIKCFAQY